MKKLVIINFIDHFVFYAIAMILPLYLTYKNLSLAEIGLLFSIMPFVSIFLRLLFAYLADQIGCKLFFIVDGISMMVANITYAISSLPVYFGFAKVCEGISTQAFWSVNRTAIYRVSPNAEEKNAAFMDAVRRIAIALSTILSGFLITALSFENTFLLLALLSLLLAAVAFMLKEKMLLHRIQKIDWADFTSQVFSLKRRKSFWQTSLAMVFSVSILTLIVWFIMPIFMEKEFGFSYEEIGVSLTVFYIASAIGSYIALRNNFNPAFLILMLLLSSAMLFMPTAQKDSFILFYLPFSFAYGILFAFHEFIIAKETKNSKTVSMDIGVLHVSPRIAQTIVLAGGGFLAQTFGFFPVFLVSFFMFIAFAVVVYKLIKS